MADDKDIIRDERLLGRFMQEQRKKNISLMTRHYSMSTDDAEDIYQDACIALFKNIKDGKLVDLSAQLSTYFTQICVFQSLKQIRDYKRMVSINDGQYDSEKVEELLGFGEPEITIEQQDSMADIINHMPPPCNVILWSFYYENLSMAAIAHLVNFNGADSVKAKKSQCMSKLKKEYSNRIKDVFYRAD
mgnify:CR=1 FL=1